ncbi:MAG: GNAT family N-acetyltransferase [Pirellulales bacterium]|nr:GNAT family N-acetyltransferase [Pirellulales bacterium]
MLIEAATRRNIREIAAIHVDAFPGHFLTQLGQPFLLHYYRLVIEYPLGILLSAKSSTGTVCGFASGFLNPPAFYSLFQQKRLRFGLCIVLPILFRPWLVQRLIHNRNRVIRTSLEEQDQHHLVELSSIAIHKKHRGQGHGKLLMDAFCHCAGQLGATTIYLTTDAENNDQVNNFYKRLGFSRERFCDAPGDRPMYKHTKPLNVDAIVRKTEQIL